MSEITSEFAIAYLLDACADCPENEGGECLTQSHCFEVKQKAIKALRQTNKIKALGDELRIYQKAITNEVALIGFNMAVAICNKLLAEGSEESNE